MAESSSSNTGTIKRGQQGFEENDEEGNEVLEDLENSNSSTKSIGKNKKARKTVTLRRSNRK